MGAHPLSIPQPPPSPGEQAGALVVPPRWPVEHPPRPRRSTAAQKGAMPAGLRAWGKPQRLLWLVLVAAGGLIAYGTVGAPSGGASTGTAAPPAQVKAWIAQADSVLVAHGTPASALDPADTWLIIQHESGGNPHAINRTDSNARAGHPSQGLMQTIPSVFNEWALPGYDQNINDPVSNIIAGIRYALARYGSLANVPGVASVRAGGGYRPY